jgi:seryl-tRNA synthetase
MIDIKLIRDNPEPFKTACKAKNFYVDIDRLLQLDNDLRKVKTRLQEITTEKNTVGLSISSPNLKMRKPRLPSRLKSSSRNLTN